MQVGRRLGSWQDSGGWVNPYITDGLIAMWDGEWNAGGGVHESTAKLWKDCCGNFDSENNWAEDGWSWGDKCYICTNKDTSGFPVPLTFNSKIKENYPSLSVEIVYTPKVNVRHALLSQYAPGSGFEDYSSNGGRCYMNGKPDFSVGRTGLGKTDSCSFVLGDNTIRGYLNSLLKKSLQFSPFDKGSIADSNNFIIGNENMRKTTFGFEGEIYCIRVYTRSLSETEVKGNFSVDKARFGLP